MQRKKIIQILITNKPIKYRIIPIKRPGHLCKSF